jgi:hypothetical protein
MKYPLLLLGLLISCFTLFGDLSLAGVSGFDSTEVFTSFGPLQMWQCSDWIEADTCIASTELDKQNLEEFDLSTDWFTHIDYYPSVLPAILAWQHNRHFITIYPENRIVFSVLYFDQFGNPPDSGYPKVVFWRDDAPDHSSLVLDLIGQQNAQQLYAKEAPLLSPGLYHYKYIAKNVQRPDEYELETSSFIVTSRPQNPESNDSRQEQVFSNSKVALSWKANDPSATLLTYRLYAGSDPDNLPLVYEGPDARFELKELRYCQKYYWKVEAVNPYGISSKSPLYSFSTIATVSRAFNYPNPFNPALNQITNIVFDMKNAGSADLSVYTEMGDLCWSRSFDNLIRGANEISYDGKDGQGRLLYNGTYICTVRKKYANGSENDKCRILVIK